MVSLSEAQGGGSEWFLFWASGRLDWGFRMLYVPFSTFAHFHNFGMGACISQAAYSSTNESLTLRGICSMCMHRKRGWEVYAPLHHGWEEDGAKKRCILRISGIFFQTEQMMSDP